jgi:uncharacterized protein Usg
MANPVKAFRGDGSTVSFIHFDSAPDSSEVYQVYVTTSADSTGKNVDSFRGDGSTTTFILTSAPDEVHWLSSYLFDDDGC